MKRLVCLLLTLCLILGMAACGGTQESETAVSQTESAPAVEEEAVAPVSEQETETQVASVPEEPVDVSLVEEPVGPAPMELPFADHDATLSVWYTYPPWLTNFIAIEEKPLFVEMTELTGIELDITGVSIINGSEQFSLMLAGGDCTDIICDFGNFYTGTYDQAIEEETIIDLTELIDTVCPNYWGIIHEDEEVAKSVVTNEGNIPSFMTINDENVYIRGGHWINVDMLNAVGREMPVTMDDWYDTLVAFRDELGAKAPLWMDNTASTADLTAAYGVIADFYQEDGQVKFGFLEDGMKDYLTMISKWYSEGLIYQDFATQADGVDKPDTTDDVQNAQTGLWRNSSNAYGYFTVNAEPVGLPVLEEGQQLHFSEITSKVGRGAEWAISGNCENPELAAKWCDFWYSEQGTLMANYGIEGLSYEMVDGKPQFTDLVANNPDISFNQAIALYALFNCAGFVNDNTRMDNTYNEQQLKSRSVWADHNDNANIYPSFAEMTIAESEQFYSKYNDIDTYISEQLPNFIIGVTSMDEYNAFVETLKTMGIEECIEIKQTALDRYNSR